MPSEEAPWKWQRSAGRMHLGGNESQVSYAWEGGFAKYPIKHPTKREGVGHQELRTTSVHLWLM